MYIYVRVFSELCLYLLLLFTLSIKQCSSLSISTDLIELAHVPADKNSLLKHFCSVKQGSHLFVTITGLAQGIQCSLVIFPNLGQQG